MILHNNIYNYYYLPISFIQFNITIIIYFTITYSINYNKINVYEARIVAHMSIT